jgi:protein ImuA
MRLMTFDPLQIPHVFQARSMQPSTRRSIPTGFSELDRALLGGWPTPCLIEVLIDAYGIGELQLLLPLFRKLTHDGPQPPLVTWLNSPYTPNRVAFAQHQIIAQHWLATRLEERDVLWGTEQALRSNACSIVLAWLSTTNMAALRRLKLAAMTSGSVGVLFRPTKEAKSPSPASLRLLMTPVHERLSIEIIKNEGRKLSQLSIDVRRTSVSA